MSKPNHIEPKVTGALKRTVALWFSAVFLLALSLRLWGIGWGLPDQDKLFSYHPDEGVNVVQGVLDKGVSRPHIQLQFYNYGTATFYVWQAAAAINRTYGFIQRPPTGARNSPSTDSFAALILIGRLISAVSGALTAGIIFLIGRKLFTEKSGILAGILYAAVPLAVVHGHYATVDSLATFFVSLCLLATANLSVETTGSFIKGCAIAGAMAGLCAAAKYNTVLVFAAPALWVALSPMDLRRRLLGLGILFAAMIVAFLIACPAPLIDNAAFIKDVAFEVQKSREGMGTLFAQTGNGWWYHLTVSMRFGLGIPLTLASVCAVMWAFRQSNRAIRALLGYTLLYYMVIGSAQVKFVRYLFPILPALCLLVPEMLRSLHRKYPLCARLTAAVIVGQALFISLAMDHMMAEPDTRDLALAHIRTLPASTTLGFVTLPWFYTPPLTPELTAPSPGLRRKAALSLPVPLRLPAAGKEWDPDVLLAPIPQAFVVSEFETGDVERLKLDIADPFVKEWKQRYTPRVFDKSPSFLGIDLSKPSYTPNDWLYPNPRVTVYELNTTNIH